MLERFDGVLCNNNKWLRQITVFRLSKGQWLTVSRLCLSWAISSTRRKSFCKEFFRWNWLICPGDETVRLITQFDSGSISWHFLASCRFTPMAEGLAPQLSFLRRQLRSDLLRIYRRTWRTSLQSVKTTLPAVETISSQLYGWSCYWAGDSVVEKLALLAKGGSKGRGFRILPTCTSIRYINPNFTEEEIHRSEI